LSSLVVEVVVDMHRVVVVVLVVFYLALDTQ
jgi:hypothetical protein